MKYELRRPCSKCPFRTDVEPYLLPARAVEIARSLERSEFPCHETTEDDEDDDGIGTRIEGPRSQHCAGALIMLEKVGQPSQMMRICQRLRNDDGRPMYDARKLDMGSPVYESPEDFVEAYRTKRKRKR